MTDFAKTRARRQSITLSELFIAEVDARCPTLTLASPRDASRRGSQVSFRHPDAYAVMQALIDSGVIGDFRAPDCLRFGVTPLYLGEAEILEAVARLDRILKEGSWDQPHFRKKAAVT